MYQDFSIAALNSSEAVVGSKVRLKGWVRTRRDSKAGLSFIHLHDGSCFNPIQLVANNDLDNYDNEIIKLTAGCSVIAMGELVESQGKGQQYEVLAEQIEVVGWVENPESYPIQAKRHTLEFLREVPHLRVRTNTIGAVCRVRNQVSQSIHQFFNQQGFYWVHTPVITGSDCEGAGELFRVSTLDAMNLPITEQGQIDYQQDFFGQEAFLTVSGQLNVETYCMAMSKVYTFGPTFRAENSNTSRHLAEFWMVEPEIAFANLDDVCQLAEALLKYVVTDLLNHRADDLEFFNKFVDKTCLSRLQGLAESSFKEVEYTEAIELLQKAKKSFEFPVEWGLDLQSEHERYLSEELFKSPVIVKNYPKDIKGFYMRLNDDNRTVAAMDVLAPGIGEIIGGSQREERLNVLTQRMAECDVDAKEYQWYADLRKYGTVAHSGFGLGLERLISYVTGLANVRDVIAFPRTPGRADC